MARVHEEFTSSEARLVAGLTLDAVSSSSSDTLYFPTNALAVRLEIPAARLRNALASVGTKQLMVDGSRQQCITFEQLVRVVKYIDGKRPVLDRVNRLHHFLSNTDNIELVKADILLRVNNNVSISDVKPIGCTAKPRAALLKGRRGMTSDELKQLQQLFPSEVFIESTRHEQFIREECEPLTYWLEDERDSRALAHYYDSMVLGNSPLVGGVRPETEKRWLDGWLLVQFGKCEWLLRIAYNGANQYLLDIIKEYAASL